ncbi:hypothetical protein DAEQUDRAFT_722686 [Daedalea quercina L-15889]|uniref:Uncharacterized protein n=1 Tax=Daedalea quercina L-15889 TaxID=1314783 RepID=A0A165SV53_9APHY|nr:hypothetical protein DAEQUDRAFT_722686 [Daedalea quercina L-15889]
MSASGWVEVSKTCLTRDAIAQTEASGSFSNVFGVVIPSGDPTWTFPTPSSASPPSSTSEVPRGYLPPMPPLFAPPPFTPSHPVFQQFKSLAISESERARKAAEEYLIKVAQEKAAELRALEVELKREVEVVWGRFKEGIDKVQQESSSSGRPTSVMARRRSSAQKGAGASHGNGATDDPSVSVRINNFVPAKTVPARMTSPTASIQVTSALSASLATSAFHYPGDQDSTRNEGVPSRSPSSSAAPSSPGRSSMTRVVSPSTASSRTATMMTFDAEASIRDAHRRNMDESKDIATSYKYVLDLEAQMAEHRRASSSTQDAGPSSAGTADTVSPAVAPRGRSPRGNRSSIKKGKEKENERPATPTRDQESQASENVDGHAKESSPKGKRKVTFDIKPDVAIIDNETADSEREKDATEDAAIFDMEDEDNPEQASLPPSPTAFINGKSTTTPPPQVTSPPRRRRPHLQDSYGLPSSLSSLRPSSLPNVQNTRPPITRRTESDRPRDSQSAKDVSGKGEERHTNGDNVGDDEPLSPDSREAHILSLVAASVPSHRSAWKKDSRAWQVFVERRGRRSMDLGPVSIEEEEESDSTVQHDTARLGRHMDEFSDDDGELFNGHTMSRDDRNLTAHNTVASSLPIPIMRNLPGAPLQPKTSLTDRPGLLVPVLRTPSSVAARRLVYAERDRNRHIDPGAFELDDAGDDEEDDNAVPDPQVGSLAAKRALQILEAAGGVPSEGMWRSLAA